MNAKRSRIYRGNQSVVTTGQAGILLGFSIKTIIKLFDAGELKGFLLPRGDGDPDKPMVRRVTVESIVALAVRVGIPVSDARWIQVLGRIPEQLAGQVNGSK
jgi:hypothetical protein